jgi:hypothetical protein
MTIVIAVLLAFGVGFMVRPFVDRNLRQDWSSNVEERYREFTRDPWARHCGFYPRSKPGEPQSSTAATFDDARTDFEYAWLVFLSKQTEADFQASRNQRDWSERKYALWDAGHVPHITQEAANRLA